MYDPMKGIVCHHFNAYFKLIKKIIKLNKLISQNIPPLLYLTPGGTFLNFKQNLK